MKNAALSGLILVSAISSMDSRADALSATTTQCDAGAEICAVVIYAFPADPPTHKHCYIRAAFEETDASATTKGFSWHLLDAADDHLKYKFIKQGGKKAIELKSDEGNILTYNEILEDSGDRMHYARLKQVDSPFCAKYDVHVRQFDASGKKIEDCDGADPVIANNRIAPNLNACP